jgi:hypothetical protein
MRYHNRAMNRPLGSSTLLGDAPDFGHQQGPPNPFRIRTYVTVHSKKLKSLYIRQLQKTGRGVLELPRLTVQSTHVRRKTIRAY